MAMVLLIFKSMLLNLCSATSLAFLSLAYYNPVSQNVVCGSPIFYHLEYRPHPRFTESESFSQDLSIFIFNKLLKCFLCRQKFVNHCLSPFTNKSLRFFFKKERVIFHVCYFSIGMTLHNFNFNFTCRRKTCCCQISSNA